MKGTEIKDQETFQWTLQGGRNSRPMTYTIDQLDDGGIYFRTDVGGNILSDLQYIYTNGVLLIVSNDMHVAKDGTCQLSIAREEGWYFARFAAGFGDQNQMENDKIITLLKSNGVVDKDFDKLKELNDSGDRENTTMVNKILKARYGSHLVLRREGISG